MSGQLRAQIQVLRDARPGFDRLADSVDTARHCLEDSLAAQGACWGSDETGRAFAESYLPAMRQVRAALGDLIGAVRGIGSAVGAVADRAEVADDRARSRFSGGA